MAARGFVGNVFIFCIKEAMTSMKLIDEQSTCNKHSIWETNRQFWFIKLHVVNTYIIPFHGCESDWEFFILWELFASHSSLLYVTRDAICFRYQRRSGLQCTTNMSHKACTCSHSMLVVEFAIKRVSFQPNYLVTTCWPTSENINKYVNLWATKERGGER